MSRKRDARIFDVDTNFHQKARQPGGITKQTAIERAQAEIDQCRPEFTDWLGRELQALHVAIRQVEENSGAPSLIDQVSYHARQLRDIGSTMGYDLVTYVADNLCDILDTTRAGARYDKDIIDCHLGALALATQTEYKNLRPDQLPELSQGLRRVYEHLKSRQEKFDLVDLSDGTTCAPDYN
jgi:hypothetical protein